MSLILLVEPEGRYVERIRDALGQSGWSINAVPDAGTALGHAASQAPKLVLVNVAVAGADQLLTTFGRRHGGPGTVALVPERRASEAGIFATRADACLVKPFTDTEIRQAVQRTLTAETDPASHRPEAKEGDRRFTSEDLFGDLIAEFERTPTRSRLAGPKPPAAPPAAPPAQAAAPSMPPGSRPLRPKSDEEIHRKLEETLSGVLGDLASRPAEVRPEGAPPPSAPTAPRRQSGTAQAPSRSVAEEVDLDALISSRLGLDLSRPRSRPPAPPAAEAAVQPPPPAAAAPQQAPVSTSPPGGELTDLPLQESQPLVAAEEMPGLAEVMEELKIEAEELPAAELPAPAPAGTPPPSPAATQRMPALGLRAAQAGTAFGQYLLQEKIAVGGMAEVWRARMQGVEGFQKTVAIKKILPHLNDNSAFLSMFVDEAKLAAQLNHPNITHIYDLGKIDGEYFIAMEYVEGRNLRAILNESRRQEVDIPLGLALLIAARLASALDYAHRKKDFDNREMGLVHRDVSPQNVLISNEGDIKLCDFGIVKAVSKASHTQMGALKGKLQYMSPEQAWGRAVDARSDLFSLGALLFETLSGRRLFPGDSEISVLEAVREAHIEPLRGLDPSIPPEVEDVVEKALQKKPEDRFQTAGAMQQSLEQLLYAIRPTPSQTDLAQFMRRLFLPAEEGAGAGAGDRAPLLPAGKAAAPVSHRFELPDLGSAVEEEPVVLEPPPELPVPAPPAAEEATGSRPGVAGTAAEKAAVPAVAAVTAVAAVAPAPGEKVELEEGGSRGKGVLIAAILAILILGLLAGWLIWLRPRQGAPGGLDQAPPVAGEAFPGAAAEAVPGAGEEAGQVPEEEGQEGAEEGAGAGPAAAPARQSPAPGEARGPGGADPARLNVEQMVEQELARRGEALRRQLEEEQKQLAAQVSEMKAGSAPAPGAAAEDPAAAEVARQAAEREAEARRKAEEERQEQQRQEQQRQAEEQRRRQQQEEEAARQAEAERNRVKVGQLVELGPGVVPPQLVSFNKPQYPPVAQRLRVEGVVEVEVLVDENGGVQEARLGQGIPQDVGINEAAVTAARSAKFRPATKDGVRVKVWTKLKIPFKL